MRTRSEKSLVLLVIAVSLGLTGLTVWAVARQGRALRAREWADLEKSAATAVAERQARLRADLERAFDAAGRAWVTGRHDDLETWVSIRREWLVAYLVSADASWAAYPRRPLQEAWVRADGLNGGQWTAGWSSGRGELLAELDRFRQGMPNPDPAAQAGALLAQAIAEQQSGHPLAAARIFGDTAQSLRSYPHLRALVLRAELAQVDALLAAGDRDRARAAFETLVADFAADHPGRLGRPEASELDRQAEALGIGADEPLWSALGDLRQRAERRTAVVDAIEQYMPRGESVAEVPVGVEAIEFVRGAQAAGESIVIAVRRIADDARLALAAPAEDLVARYWDSSANDVPWQIRLAGGQSRRATLARLGPEFAHAVVQPKPAVAERFQAAARRRLGMVLATLIGSVGAWGLVIGMMVRVVGHQRELARLQGRFVADVSHELKTPLALIRLLAETLADRRVRDPERIQSYHETITREAERLSVLLDNILDLGRIESGRKRYEFAACDVADVARQAWTLFEPQWAEGGFEARLEIEDELPVIRADPQALQQVMVNLLQNAYRYAGEGKYVRLAVAREGYLIVITIEDHGIGMNRAELGRLGESFFRADDTRVRQTRGAGLGLAIVNHIVTAHRGKLEVQSRPGEGSTFTIWIPFEPVQEAQPTA